MAVKTPIEELQAFAAAWMDMHKRGGQAQDIADMFGVSLRQVFRKRAQACRELAMRLPALGELNGPTIPVKIDHVHIEIEGAYRVLIGSDWHIWPGEHIHAEDVFFAVLRANKFDAVVLNGDVTDQPTVSRFGAGPGEYPPSLVDEITEAVTRVGEVAKLARKRNRQCALYWTWGNHDDRLDKHLLRHAGELEGLKGTTIEDHFPDWRFALSLDIEARVVIKHQYHSGMHSAYNNVLRSGSTLVTGHTHRLLCRPWSDYTGTRYGIETGCLADPHGPQFRYGNNNPRDQQQGFVVLDITKYDDGHIDVAHQLIDCTLRSPRLDGTPA